MSWRGSLAKLAMEFGEDAVRAASRVLARDATEAQARGALERIMRTMPAEVDFTVRPAAVKKPAKPLDMRHEARMERAASMGFDTAKPLYVSALQPTERFAPHGKFMGRTGLSGISLTDNPRMASRYLERYGDIDYRGQPFVKNMMPVLIKPGVVKEFEGPLSGGARMGFPLPENYTWPSGLAGIDTAIFPDALSSRGGVKHVDPASRGVIAGREYVLRDPRRVRSLFAAFDPDAAESDVLLKAQGGSVVKRKKGKR